MSDGQGEVQRQIDADRAAYTEGPPIAYQATGGADWQSQQGWGYRPANKAAIAHRLKRWADATEQLARDMAAVGMGRGVWPEHSAEMLGASSMARSWAEGIETEVAAKAAERGEA